MRPIPHQKMDLGCQMVVQKHNLSLPVCLWPNHEGKSPKWFTWQLVSCLPGGKGLRE